MSNISVNIVIVNLIITSPLYLHSLWFRSVPQRLFSCTEYVSECGLYPRGPSHVPNTFRSAVRTPETHLLYQTRFGVRFVPQSPFSCTEYVSECGLYPRVPSPAPNTFRVRFVPQRPFSCTELCWESFRASESLILCRVHPNKCTMWLLAYGKMALLMSIRVAEKQKSESGAI